MSFGSPYQGWLKGIFELEEMRERDKEQPPISYCGGVTVSIFRSNSPLQAKMREAT